MKWNIPRKWEGQDSFIIGGGPSLKDFNWEVLKGKNVIGINQAYEHGPSIVSYTFFGDLAFFLNNTSELKNSGIPLVTNHRSFKEGTSSWVLGLERVSSGVSLESHALAWNYSSGAAAINLALLLGSQNIYLLGFDGGGSPEGKTAWHDAYKKTTSKEAFIRHARGLNTLALAVKKEFPFARIVNCNLNSMLTCFEKEALPL